MRKADKWSKVINFFFRFILKVYYITYLSSKRVGFIHIFYDIWNVIFSGDSYSSIIGIKIILEKICILHKLNGLGNGATKIMEINTNINTHKITK